MEFAADGDTFRDTQNGVRTLGRKYPRTLSQLDRQACPTYTSQAVL